MYILLSCAHQAQNRTTYYAPNQLAQMRPNPRWQQQGGRGQGEHRALYDDACICKVINLIVIIRLYFNRFNLFLFLLVLHSGGFQGIPSSLRQPGPRANLRHMTPSSSTQGPRGVFTSDN